MHKIIVGDKEFFFMIDNQVREKMPRYEVDVMLPKIEEIFRYTKIKEGLMEKYPVEGYYYRTPKLTHYFQLLRNLQENKKIFLPLKDNKKVLKSQNFKDLKELTSNPLFGSEPSDRMQRGGGPVPLLPRRMDILTLAIRNEMQWSIPSLMKSLKKYATGNPNLVELAYLTKEAICLIAGAETNSVYRDYARLKGGMSSPKYEWKVSKEVEKLGKKIVDEYNKFLHVLNNGKIKLPTIDNCNHMSMKPKLPRVATLGLDPRRNEWYSWIAKEDGTVEELWSKEIYTTEQEREKIDKVYKESQEKKAEKYRQKWINEERQKFISPNQICDKCSLRGTSVDVQEYIITVKNGNFTQDSVTGKLCNDCRKTVDEQVQKLLALIKFDVEIELPTFKTVGETIEEGDEGDIVIRDDDGVLIKDVYDDYRSGEEQEDE